MNKRNVLWCIASVIATLAGSSAMGMQSELEELNQSLKLLQCHNIRVSTQQSKAASLQFYKKLFFALTKIKTKPQELPYEWHHMVGGKYFQKITAFSALPNNTGIRIDVEPRADNPPRKRRDTQLDLVIEKVAEDCNLSARAIFGDYGTCIGYKIVPQN